MLLDIIKTDEFLVLIGKFGNCLFAFLALGLLFVLHDKFIDIFIHDDIVLNFVFLNRNLFLNLFDIRKLILLGSFLLCRLLNRLFVCFCFDVFIDNRLFSSFLFCLLRFFLLDSLSLFAYDCLFCFFRFIRCFFHSVTLQIHY